VRYLFFPFPADPDPPGLIINLPPFSRPKTLLSFFLFHFSGFLAFRVSPTPGSEKCPPPPFIEAMANTPPSSSFFPYFPSSQEICVLVPCIPFLLNVHPLFSGVSACRQSFFSCACGSIASTSFFFSPLFCPPSPEVFPSSFFFSLPHFLVQVPFYEDSFPPKKERASFPSPLSPPPPWKKLGVLFIFLFSSRTFPFPLKCSRG